jgi:gliding motility-associated-like protein
MAFFILSASLYGQGDRFNKWYFGNRAGLDFNTSPPTVLTDSKMNTYEGSASISDDNGKLLFYTNGDSIWNSDHDPMLNGYGLKGHSSSTQSCLITSYPGNTDKYYLFTSDQASNYDGLHYSIIDMTLDNEKGGVDSTIKNIMLTDSVSEKLCAAIHSNGYDYWIIVKRPFSTIFHAYLVNCDGIVTTPVISNAGNLSSQLGYMKASKDGKCIVSAEMSSNGHVLLHDLDNTNGSITFKEVISQTASKHYYGVEFSPNDEVIYVSNNSSIHQYDRFATNVCSTETIISHVGFPAGPMQLAPDNKIYISIDNQHMMSVISDPDNLTAPGLNIAYQSLGGSARYSIPSFFYPFPTHQTNFEYNLKDTVVCPENSFITNAHLPDSFTYEWAPSNIFSDPNSALPEINITENTTAYITITDAYACRKADSTIMTTDIELCPVTEIFIPKAFSPNNDGTNDQFFIRGTQVENYQLEIFDRWGKIVFSSKNQMQGWNGLINETESSNGVFIWHLKYTDKNNVAQTKKGNVSLIR